MLSTAEVEGEPRAWLWSPLYYGAAFLLSLAALAVATHLPQQRLDIPINFSGDALPNSIPARAVEDGEPLWHISRMAAPFHYNLLIYWQGNVLGIALLSLLALFISPAGSALLLAWFIKAAFAGVTAAWALRQLRVEPAVALAFSVAYAVMPYALGNHSDMYTLSTHIQPVFAAMAVLLLMGDFHEMPLRRRFWFYAGAAAAGMDDIYTAYFCCFLLCAVMLLALLLRRFDAFRHAAIPLAITVVCIGINFAPALFTQAQNPYVADYVSQRGAPKPEVHLAQGGTTIWGVPLELRILLAPVSGHLLPPLAAITCSLEESYGGDLFTTRRMAMGTLGALGLIALLARLALRPVLAKPSQEWHARALATAAVLTFACLLLGTSSGIYQFIGTFFFAMVRAYFRLVPFLVFFAYLALALPLSIWLARKALKGMPLAAAHLGLAALAALAVLDQMGDYVTPEFLRGQQWQYDNARQFVSKVEESLAPGAMVYQFPDTMRARFDTHVMGSFDQMRGYLLSDHIRWSYSPPPRTDEPEIWHRRFNELPPEKLLNTLLLAGFDGVWIDRYGYKDYAESLMPFFANAPGVTTISSGGGPPRYVFYNLTETRRNLQAQMGPEAYLKAQRRVLADPKQQ